MARFLVLLLASLFLYASPVTAQSKTTTAKPAKTKTTPTTPAPTTPAPAPTATKATTSATININTANAAELDKLNGIGEVTAKKIIEYRDANGPFKSIEDLTKVSGIGPKTLDKFRDQVSIDGSAAVATTKTPSEAATKTTPVAVSTAAKININTANAAELNKLNGVGDVTSKKIIEYREANGPFKSIEDLNKVNGIGPKTLDKFRDQVTIGDGAATPSETTAKSGSPSVQAPTEAEPVAKTTVATAVININTATAKELTKLPGVGDTTAQRIIEYRQANGPFAACKDLNKVKGIGDKTLEKIVPACAVK